MKLLAHSGSRVVAERIDAVAANDPRRAAILLSDLYSYRKPLEDRDHTYLEHRAYETGMKRTTASMNRVVSHLQNRDSVLEQLSQLPTLDAYRFRREVLAHTLNDSAVLPSAAVLRITGERDIPEIVWSGYLADKERDLFSQNIADVMRQRFASPVDKPTLSPRYQTLLEHFHERVRVENLFPLERYGYAGISKELERAKDSYGVAQVALPWRKNLDLPNPDCHQCHDSALTARSYFSALGIPADIWVVGIGDTLHNIAVVYFPEANGFTPVVVDASPYGGMYSVEAPNGKKQVTFFNPVGIQEVRRIRGSTMPIMSGDGFYKARINGLLPWFCQDLSKGKGRIVAMAGVQANQEHGGFFVRSFSVEARGRGIRDPKIVLSLTLFPGKDSKFAQKSGKPCGSLVVTEKKNGTLKILEQDPNLSEKKVARMLEVAKERFSSIKKTVDRLDIDLRKRVFNVDDYP